MQNSSRWPAITSHFRELGRFISSGKIFEIRHNSSGRCDEGIDSREHYPYISRESGPRVSKTLHVLAYVNDESYRRRIVLQRSSREGRHSLARAVCHGRRGELYQKYQRGLEEQLGSLGFVVNCVVLWNTRYAEAILNHLRGIGEDVLDVDVARLSPLKFAHINVLGRYHFEMSEEVGGGDLRLLRDPDSLETLERLWEN